MPYTLGAKFFAPSQEHHVLLCPCTPDSLHTHSVCPLKQQRSQCHNFYKCSPLVLPLYQWSSQEDLLISPASEFVNVNVIVVHSKVSHMISLQGFQHLGPWALLLARCGMPQQLSVSVVNRTETEHSWSSSGAENPSWQVDELSLQQECLLSTRSETTLTSDCRISKGVQLCPVCWPQFAHAASALEQTTWDRSDSQTQGSGLGSPHSFCT